MEQDLTVGKFSGKDQHFNSRGLPNRTDLDNLIRGTDAEESTASINSIYKRGRNLVKHQVDIPLMQDQKLQSKSKDFF